MEFDEQLYLVEMETLLRSAKAKLISEYPNLMVYTVSIWTDPEAAVSAVNFDTAENSQAKVEQQNQWNRGHYEGAIADGDHALAEFFKPQTSRNYNPADFFLTRFRQTKHRSIEHAWETNSDGKCWEALEPALYQVGTFANMLLANLKLHPEAELGVNSRLDWFDAAWRLKG